MIAETISPFAVFSADTALDLETPACVITSSMSLGSTPVSSTCQKSSIPYDLLGSYTKLAAS